MVAAHDEHLAQLFRRNYARCKIGRGQKVVVLSEGDQLRDYALASIAAARALGAEVEDLNIPADNALDANARMNISARIICPNFRPRLRRVSVQIL